MTAHPPARFAGALLAPAVCVAMFTSGLARADEADAFNFFIGQTLTYDDNLFRISDSIDDQRMQELLGDTKRGDTVSTTYAGVTFNKLLSRQTLHADLAYNINRYSHYSALDYNGLRANANWGWQFGNYLKGTLSYERNRQLIDFGNLNLQDRNSREAEINTYDRLYASADWWFHPEYSFGAGYAHSNSNYSSVDRQASEYEADAVELNAKFQPKTGNLIGLSLRQTKGNYPNREVARDVTGNVIATADNSFDQTDAEVNGDWRLTGQSRVFGRLGYTTRKHDQVTQRDFSGMTGRLTYNWALEGKTSINLSLRREIGAVEDIDASYVLTNGITLNPIWYPTAKISLSAKYDWSKRRYQGDPFNQTGSNASGQSARNDTVNKASVSGTYLPLRSLQLSLTFQHERRTSSIEFADYRDNLASLSAQFSF